VDTLEAKSKISTIDQINCSNSIDVATNEQTLSHPDPRVDPKMASQSQLSSVALKSGITKKESTFRNQGTSPIALNPLKEAKEADLTDRQECLKKSVNPKLKGYIPLHQLEDQMRKCS
jgi:hypothetical protein